ncbi:FAD NAD P-binding domain-containing [Mycena venus]|uniref:FAD NAD P-binding domain-containing n=1 Tax=Mycena venus TaxID=2733690 RepID=A0A8H7CXI8_9AGAR|nr:FAD NAD P-binding domain-containing [Mycena venus]
MCLDRTRNSCVAEAREAHIAARDILTAGTSWVPTASINLRCQVGCAFNSNRSLFALPFPFISYLQDRTHTMLPAASVPAPAPHLVKEPGDGGGSQVLRLHIIIVGCGIGGLSAAYCLGRAGHRVTVLERASEIKDVGAGIQVGPNLSRLLIRWGLGEQLEKVATRPEAITFLRYSDGERIGWTRWGSKMEEEHGAPYYHVHRADLLHMLHTLAAPRMALRLSSKVVSVSVDPGPTAQAQVRVGLANGEIVSGDLVIGADGIKSVVREVVLSGLSNSYSSDRDGPSKKATTPIHTGDCAYRAVISTAGMRGDPALEGLLESKEMISWMGPRKHIIGYCIRGKTEYNLVLVHPDNRFKAKAKESYMTEGSVEQMRADFEGWEPRVQKLLKLVDKTYILPLMYREPLDKWVHADGKVILLGDACHPTLPSRAQGSAMAVEDAAVLGSLLARLSHRTQLATLLRAYQGIRYARTRETQLAAFANHHIFHLEDGPAQRARDERVCALRWTQRERGRRQTGTRMCGRIGRRVGDSLGMMRRRRRRGGGWRMGMSVGSWMRMEAAGIECLG